MPRLTFPRESYVPAGALKVRDKQSDAVAYLYERNGALYALTFVGKQARPLWHFRFKDAAARERRIVQAFEGRRASLAFRADQLATRKAALAKPHELQVGHVLICSWGYDQTNIDWYQVVELVGARSVRLRRLRGIVTRSDGWASGQCVPDLDDDSATETLLKRVGAGGGVKIKSYASAHLWDGRPRSWTAYA